MHDFLMYCSGGAIALSVFVMFKAYSYVKKAEERDSEFYLKHELNLKHTVRHEESIGELIESHRAIVTDQGILFDDMKYLTGESATNSEKINEHSQFIESLRDCVGKLMISAKSEEEVVKEEEEVVNKNDENED